MRRSPSVIVALTAIALVASAAPAVGSPGGRNQQPEDRRSRASSDGAPPPSSWAGTLQVAPTNEYATESDGDLWPSCWADDGAVYTAWGDGRGFDPDGEWVDLGTAKITGEPGSLQGDNTALSEDVVPLWNEGVATRKPTGMVCVGNTLYLAAQDLSYDFSHAPAATIMKSTDGGETWTGDRTAPMFDDHVFTTIWFADFGPGGDWSTSKYVYAYGLDGNWRNSPPPFNDVPDPQQMFLARVPKDKITDRQHWDFFTGYQKDGSTPTWSHKITEKQPVLTDTRRDYPRTFSGADWTASSVLGQGGVTYNPILDRYIYAGWSEYVHHFYESPTPWGPWKLITDVDYTPFDDRDVQYSGYGTSFPSKFIAEDGTMMMQSNRCCGGTEGYQFALRPVTIMPHDDTVVNPEPDGSNLARDSSTVAISKSVSSGTLTALSNDDRTDSLDDWDDEVKRDSWWGYSWPADRKINRLTFTTGSPATDGGWFITRPRVQYRSDGAWHDVAVQGYTSAFEPGRAAGDHARYTVRFPDVTADGIRILGTPGGDHTYSSISEVSAHFDDAALVDGGFENTIGYNAAWRFDGTAGHGIDRGGCCARTGQRNAWIRTSEALGEQYITQSMAVTGGTDVDLSAWAATTPVVQEVFLGIRWDGGSDIASLTPSGADEYRQYDRTVTVPEGVTSAEVVIGYSADGGDAILQVDDVEVTAAD